MRKSRAFKLLANVCRLILACTFIVSGFTKVIDPWGTAMKVNEYLSIYGMESLQGASMAFSIWLCGAEMMMGCMLLFKVRIRLISIFAVLSMLFFTALTLLSATVIPVEDCGCFGEALKLTPWETFYKNLALLPMALVALPPRQDLRLQPPGNRAYRHLFLPHDVSGILLLPPPAADRLPAL